MTSWIVEGIVNHLPLHEQGNGPPAQEGVVAIDEENDEKKVDTVTLPERSGKRTRAFSLIGYNGVL